MPPSPPIIELRRVSKSFPGSRNGDGVTALQDFSLSIEERIPGKEQQEGYGQFVALLGPSGCGKSTILSLIAGLVRPDSGEVLVFGQKILGPHHFSATVPQAYTCFPWLTALQNVEFGLRLQGKSDAERTRVAKEYLEKVGLADFPGAHPDKLSGGMKQRVAIARALAMKRKIVLMDEPFGALDAQTRADMQQMLLQLWETEKNTIVFVTHDITEALLLADRVVVFSPRPASTLHDVVVPFPFARPPEIVHSPEFIACAEELRRLLHQRHAEAAPPPAPLPAAGAGSPGKNAAP